MDAFLSLHCVNDARGARRREQRACELSVMRRSGLSRNATFRYERTYSIYIHTIYWLPPWCGVLKTSNSFTRTKPSNFFFRVAFPAAMLRGGIVVVMVVVD